MITLPSGHRLVLASGSPRRRRLLGSAGVDALVRPADIDETPIAGESPVDYVRRLSAEKAATVMHAGDIVVAADTTVEVDGSILEKPVDHADARRMLSSLSGRSHFAHTGVTVACIGTDGVTSETIVVSTEVVFTELTDSMIDWYLATGEADDKAGAYGLQGAAGAFIERVDGSVTNVIGLPLVETLDIIRRVAGDIAG